jgi:hypothetical protein
VSAPTHGVLREAWGLYKAHWQHLLGVALVVFAGMALIRAVAAFLFEPTLAWLVAFVVTLLGYFLVQGALVKAVADSGTAARTFRFPTRFAPRGSESARSRRRRASPPSASSSGSSSSSYPGSC